MRLVKRFLLVLFLLTIVGYVILSYSLSNRILTTNSSFDKTLHDIEKYWDTSYEDMMAMLPPPSDFAVQSDDGLSISGKYFAVSDSASCLFIFAHGWARSWPNMLKYYPVVEQCGCDIIMYDHRAHGDSEGDFPTGGIMESKDLLSVTDWAKENKQFDYDQIAWVGSSWGAGAALIAGADHRNPAFIIADSPYEDWYTAIFERAIEDYGSWINGIAPAVMFWVNLRAEIDYREASPIVAAKAIEEPVFLIHSKADPKTNSQQSVNIADHLNASSVFYHTEWGNIHVMDVISNRSEVQAMITQFIQQNKLEAFMPETEEKVLD